MNHTEVVLPLAKWQASSGSISGTANEKGGLREWGVRNTTSLDRRNMEMACTVEPACSRLFGSR
jgi:hypothetical protein